MDIAIHGGVRAPNKTISADKRRDGPKNFFLRFMDALAASRIRQARHMIEMYAHMMAPDSEAFAFDETEERHQR
jgi:hypothetical protein